MTIDQGYVSPLTPRGSAMRVYRDRIAYKRGELEAYRRKYEGSDLIDRVEAEIALLERALAAEIADPQPEWLTKTSESGGLA